MLLCGTNLYDVISVARVKRKRNRTKDVCQQQEGHQDRGSMKTHKEGTREMCVLLWVEETERPKL